MKKVVNILLVVAIVSTFLFLGSVSTTADVIEELGEAGFDGAEVASFQEPPPGCCFPVELGCCED